MDWVEKIRRLTDNQKLLDFTAFVVQAKGDRQFPDYKKLDLMQIAPLVRHAWAMYFRDGVDNRPKLIFSGTHIDQHYEMNITGKSFEEMYKEEDFERAIRGNYYQVYLQKRASYTRRLAHYFDDHIDRYKTIEAMLFPCSSDGITINYGIGFCEYKPGDEPPDKVFELL